MIENFAAHPSQEQLLNSLSETSVDWEGFSSHTETDAFKIEGEVANYIEETLNSEGIRNV